MNSWLRPVSNSIARSGAGVWADELKTPKYWPPRALGKEVEVERKKARPKPGLVEIWGRIEKMNWVEKEMVELELLGDRNWIGEGWKALPIENWLESLVRRMTGGSRRESLVRVIGVVVVKELWRNWREVVGWRWRRRRRTSWRSIVAL